MFPAPSTDLEKSLDMIKSVHGYTKLPSPDGVANLVHSGVSATQVEAAMVNVEAAIAQIRKMLNIGLVQD